MPSKDDLMSGHNPGLPSELETLQSWMVVGPNFETMMTYDDNMMTI